jgi:hypothetical protein
LFSVPNSNQKLIYFYFFKTNLWVKDFLKETQTSMSPAKWPTVVEMRSCWANSDPSHSEFAVNHGIFLENRDDNVAVVEADGEVVMGSVGCPATSASGCPLQLGDSWKLFGQRI